LLLARAPVDIPHFLSLPRGQSSAADALALSLMSVGAGRLSHLYHSEAGEDPSVEGNSRRYEELSVALMQASLGLGQTSLAFARLKGKGFGPALSIGSASASSSAAAAVDGTVASGALPQQQQQQPGPGMDDSEITHLLAACSSCILARCLAGGRGFEGALDLARGVVEFAGGPKKMLDALSSSGGSSSASTSAPPPAAGSATITSLDPPSMSTTTGYPTAGGSLGASSLTTPTTTSKATRRKRLRMLRSVLEDLASWDLFASLSSGAKPSAFSSSSPHAANSGGGLAEWLFAYSPPSGTREGTSGEEDWETLESTLGFSRILMDLFSRVSLFALSTAPHHPPLTLAVPLRRRSMSSTRPPAHLRPARPNPRRRRSRFNSCTRSGSARPTSCARTRSSLNPSSPARAGATSSRPRKSLAAACATAGWGGTTSTRAKGSAGVRHGDSSLATSSGRSRSKSVSGKPPPPS
jgi:hypothetical protein